MTDGRHGWLQQLVQGKSLEAGELLDVLEALLEGRLSEVQSAALLTALATRGEGVEELLACVHAVRNRGVGREQLTAFPWETLPCLDTCGTGGDGLEFVNVSSLTSLVVAACGVRVAKHGNRAVSSVCGSADFFEASGVVVDLAASKVRACLEQTGFAFFFAPRFYPALARLAPLRRALGFRSLLNLVGPLCNPAGIRYHLLGVSQASWCLPFAQVLGHLGVEAALVVHGGGGEDEVSICAPTTGYRLQGGRIEPFRMEPGELGLTTWSLDSLRARCPRELAGDRVALQARAVAWGHRVLQGEAGMARDAVLVNAAAALWIAGRANSLRDGVTQASQALDSGAAWQKLQEVCHLTRDLALCLNDPASGRPS